MSVAKYYIDHFNKLNGKTVTKERLQILLAQVKKANHKQLKEVEEKLSKVIGQMNGKPVTLRVTPVKFEENAPEPKREVKKTVPPVKRKASNEVAKVPSVVKEKPVSSRASIPVSTTSKNVKGLAGFTTADKIPEKPADLFTLKGDIGKFLGELQRFRLQIIIDGEKFSSKSELVKQIANAFIDHGFKTALIDYEMGGLISKDTQSGIKRNVSPENRKKLFVSPTDFPTTLEAVKKLALHFDAILIDSGSKLEQVTNVWLDELRTEYPNTIWVVLMQQNSKGGTKGGTAAGYNAPVIIKTFRLDETDQLKNYAKMDKNRGNTMGWYIIAKKKYVTEDPAKVKEVKTVPLTAKVKEVKTVPVDKSNIAVTV